MQHDYVTSTPQIFEVIVVDEKLHVKLSYKGNEHSERILTIDKLQKEDINFWQEDVRPDVETAQTFVMDSIREEVEKFRLNYVNAIYRMLARKFGWT